jgi:hypothetical protein
MHNEKLSPDNQAFFDKPQNVTRILHVFYICCALLFALDFVIHRHTVHSWENLWGFYPIYGFVGCVVLVIVAKWMRTFLMRPEDYYDSEASGKEGAADVDENQLLSKESSGLENNHRTEAGGHNVDA